MMTREEADLVEYLSDRILEQNIERIRLWALAGGDAPIMETSMKNYRNDLEEIAEPAARQHPPHPCSGSGTS